MMMFRHLSAEEFTNLLDGTPLPDHRRAHLQSCAHCLHRFTSVQEVRNEIEVMHAEEEDYIPEPDWAEFRSDVRNTMLSRSIRRENASRSWFLKPAAAWAFSMAVVAVLVVSGVLWNMPGGEPATAGGTLEDPPMVVEEFTALAAMSEPDALDALLHLSQDEAESLSMILDDIAESVSQQ